MDKQTKIEQLTDEMAKYDCEVGKKENEINKLSAEIEILEDKAQEIFNQIKELEIDDITPEELTRQEAKKLPFLSSVTENKIIRKALRKLCKKAGVKPLSVRTGKGTGYCWTHINGSLEFGKFTEEEEKVLIDFEMVWHEEVPKDLISPDEKKYWVQKSLDVLGGSINDYL